MKIAVPAEQAAGETRVAAVPDSVKAYVRKKAEVALQAGAGAGSFIADEAYAAQGATIVKDVPALVKDADVVLTVRRPPLDLVKAMKKGALLIGQLDPYGDRAGLEGIAGHGIAAFSLELLPRITRAQSMDVLSSQANLAGYKAVVDAAAAFGRALPMMMTAAGTVPAARVFVMGVGVAGLQAIATARRLGAVVSATDVRAAAAEQVASLGAKFIMVEGMKDAATAGGYAKELSEEDRRKQAALIAEHIKGQDVVITTALIPGRPAPRLVTRAMVESMKPGSVIVDLAVERGGNCELAKAGETVRHNGVAILGQLNLPAQVPGNASPLYAKNLANFLDPLIDKETGALKLNWEDELVVGTLICRDGAIVHPSLKR
jgi:NAD(P) transhydrogenase subunit alpha